MIVLCVLLAIGAGLYAGRLGARRHPDLVLHAGVALAFLALTWTQTTILLVTPHLPFTIGSALLLTGQAVAVVGYVRAARRPWHRL